MSKETSEQEKERLDRMSDEIERLKTDGLSDDAIRSRLEKKWPGLTPKQMAQAFDWWKIDMAEKRFGTGRFAPPSSEDSVH